MEFNRFAIVEAYYLFASLHHGGQNSGWYGVLSRLSNMRFRPSPVLSVENMDEDTREVYESLVAKYVTFERDLDQEPIPVVLPASWTPGIVYGDTSGMYDWEVDAMNAWLTANPGHLELIDGDQAFYARENFSPANMVSGYGRQWNLRPDVVTGVQDYVSAAERNAR